MGGGNNVVLGSNPTRVSLTDGRNGYIAKFSWNGSELRTLSLSMMEDGHTDLVFDATPHYSNGQLRSVDIYVYDDRETYTGEAIYSGSRLTAINIPDEGMVQVDYNADGLVSRVTTPDGDYATLNYQDGRLVSLTTDYESAITARWASGNVQRVDMHDVYEEEWWDEDGYHERKRNYDSYATVQYDSYANPLNTIIAAVWPDWTKYTIANNIKSMTNDDGETINWDYTYEGDKVTRCVITKVGESDRYTITYEY